MSYESSNLKKPLPYVIDKITDWPIYNLSKDRESFLNEVVDITIENLLKKYNTATTLHDELKSVLYQEKIRLTQTPWKSDKPEERIFWSEIKSQILNSSKLENEQKQATDKNILRTILWHYANEIIADFDPGKYKFARKALPWLFSRLMNASPGRRFKFLWSSKKTIYEKMRITGNIEHIRKLAKNGTLIVVPTHFSNLDSPTIGLAINNIGIPAFTYGAGINLFTLKILSNLMHKLGAYKIDRRKKNAFYIELLKNYSMVAIKRGTNSLFFPGGSRSRSGAIEQKLKLGLIGTALQAQKRILKEFPEETAQKIFIVPAVLNYHFVLEAQSLINQHLSREGKEQFIQDGLSYATSYKIIKLLFNFLTATPGMTISFGKPMDVFGNPVDEDGNSLSKNGKVISIKDYFMLNGKITDDSQRDSVYTNMLGEQIVKSFFENNTVLSSHIVAFVAFEMIKQKFQQFDLYELMRIPTEDAVIEYNDFVLKLEEVRNQLLDLNQKNKVKLSMQLHQDTLQLVEHGIKHMGAYHAERVLYVNAKKQVATDNVKLLYFYHNRLNGYNLEF